MIRANCRERFTAADFDFVVRTLARSQTDHVSLVDLLSDAETRDSVLDSPRLIDAILSNGGTGIANRDTTYDVIAGLLEKRLDGFGELFRMLSFEEIGAAAMLSRAVAGVYRRRIVVAMPGSTNAVTVAMERLIVPELAHMVYELRK